MGLKEIRIHCRKCISRVVIVALSAQPPGVNKLCVCVPRILFGTGGCCRELEEEVMIILSRKSRDYLYDDLTHYGIVA
jgi:hypothetical protein